MQDTTSSAMTEVALGLSMAFFTLLIVSLLSMSIPTKTATPVAKLPEHIKKNSAVDIKIASTNKSDGKQEIQFAFFFDDKFYDQSLAVRSIDSFSTEEKLSSVTDSVVTNLSTGDLYSASKDKGAFKNDKQISVHKEKPLYKIVGINSSGSSPELMNRLAPIFEKHHHIRHMGANALEMAMLAEGLIDIFIDLRKKIRIQDLAGGYLLIKEAGGLILDENLQPLDSDLNYDTRLSFVAAANKNILDEIFSLIK